MISETIKKLRILNKLTQKQVAEVLSIDRSTYAYYESGRTKPDITALVKLSRLYGISIDYLLNSGVSKDSRMLHDSKEMKNSECLKSTDKLTKLQDDEKKIVMFYRVCKDKDRLLKIVRDFVLKQNSQGD